MLEELDFTPPCGFPKTAAHPAEAALVCRSCRATVLLCHAHVDWLRSQLGKRDRGPVTCAECYAQRASLDAIAEVIPL